MLKMSQRTCANVWCVSFGLLAIVSFPIGFRVIPHVIQRRNERRVQDALCEPGLSAEETLRNELFTALKERNEGYLEAVIKEEADVNARDKDGHTALQLAACGGREAIVKRLIAAGADAGAITRNGSTALHFAALKGHASVIEKLIAAGADVTATTEDGKTAYELATERGHNACARLLSEHVS